MLLLLSWRRSILSSFYDDLRRFVTSIRYESSPQLAPRPSRLKGGHRFPYRLACKTTPRWQKQVFFRAPSFWCSHSDGTSLHLNNCFVAQLTNWFNVSSLWYCRSTALGCLQDFLHQPSTPWRLGFKMVTVFSGWLVPHSSALLVDDDVSVPSSFPDTFIVSNTVCSALQG